MFGQQLTLIESSVCVFFEIPDGEKKAKKRPYEEIRPNDEDFASQSSPAEPPQVKYGLNPGEVLFLMTLLWADLWMDSYRTTSFLRCC